MTISSGQQNVRVHVGTLPAGAHPCGAHPCKAPDEHYLHGSDSASATHTWCGQPVSLVNPGLHPDRDLPVCAHCALTPQGKQARKDYDNAHHGADAPGAGVAAPAGADPGPSV